MRLINFFVLVYAVTAALIFSGCVSSPFHSVRNPPTISKKLPDGGILKPDEIVTSTDVSPVQKIVNWQTDLMIWSGCLCLIAAGALAYFQMYFMAVKVGMAGLILPIFAVWYSHYWGWIIAGSLISVALLAYSHWKLVLQPIVKATAKDISEISGISKSNSKSNEIQKKI